jgi:creatinine amidohydrolase
MRNLIIDISRSLIRSGFKRLFIINGHGGNKATIDATLVDIKQIMPEMRIYSFTILDIAKQKFDEIRKSRRGLVGHADEIETSMMLAIAPERVNMGRAVREKPSIPEPLSFEPNGIATISFAWNASDLTASGVIGDPTLATAETGRVLLDFAAQVISNAVNQL